MTDKEWGDKVAIGGCPECGWNTCANAWPPHNVKCTMAGYGRPRSDHARRATGAVQAWQTEGQRVSTPAPAHTMSKTGLSMAALLAAWHAEGFVCTGGCYNSDCMALVDQDAAAQVRSELDRVQRLFTEEADQRGELPDGDQVSQERAPCRRVATVMVWLTEVVDCHAGLPAPTEETCSALWSAREELRGLAARHARSVEQCIRLWHLRLPAESK